MRKFLIYYSKNIALHDWIIKLNVILYEKRLYVVVKSIETIKT